ncbi:hypothetical protein [Streptomyces sp. NPDC057438]|uniref:hypothetical protein n=1 Tax=Streptomyces sp. NPDC057438 TaxID=3346133 RepID=UPI00367449D4
MRRTGLLRRVRLAVRLLTVRLLRLRLRVRLRRVRLAVRAGLLGLLTVRLGLRLVLRWRHGHASTLLHVPSRRGPGRSVRRSSTSGAQRIDGLADK